MKLKAKPLTYQKDNTHFDLINEEGHICVSIEFIALRVKPPHYLSTWEHFLKPIPFYADLFAAAPETAEKLHQTRIINADLTTAKVCAFAELDRQEKELERVRETSARRRRNMGEIQDKLTASEALNTEMLAVLKSNYGRNASSEIRAIIDKADKE